MTLSSIHPLFFDKKRPPPGRSTSPAPPGRSTSAKRVSMSWRRTLSRRIAPASPLYHKADGWMTESSAFFYEIKNADRFNFVESGAENFVESGAKKAVVLDKVEPLRHSRVRRSSASPGRSTSIRTAWTFDIHPLCGKAGVDVLAEDFVPAEKRVSFF